MSTPTAPLEPPRDLSKSGGPAALLCPPPRQVESLDAWQWPARPDVRLGPGIDAEAHLVERLLHHLASGSRTPRLLPKGSTEGHLHLHLDDALDVPQDGYRIRLDAEGGRLEARSEQGLFYAVATFGQWLRLNGADATHIPGVAVTDWPDYPQRGVMLDISRNKVPRLATLEGLIDLLADLKINHLQLYTEHTFAYRGHETVWQDASPLTADDIRHLDRYCAQRFIELVPNQNSFGHFHRWLIHEPYRQLAECPAGIEHPFSDEPEPFSLCPVDDRVLPLLQDLYDQLLPLFRSRVVNVDLDETLDLGLGRSAEACRERGQETVYLEFLQAIHRDLKRRGHRMMYWGDIVLEHPELIPRLPEDGIILAWGYEANFPFDDKARQFADSGLEFWMCPGTSTWSSFAGRGDNALHNLAHAALAGQRHGSGGYLITDWGDHGHLQPLPASYLGFVAGAAVAWNVSCAHRVDELPVAAWIDAHALGDPASAGDDHSLGQILVDLANAYLHTNAPPPGGKKINGSALFFQLVFAHKPVELRRGDGMTPAHLEATRRHIAATMDRLPTTTGLVERELRWLGDILDLACRLADARFDVGLEAPLSALPRTLRQQLDAELATLIAQRRDLWMERHRPGGWSLSARKLERVRQLLMSQPELLTS